jgi:hypothetical protein
MSGGTCSIPFLAERWRKSFALHLSNVLLQFGQLPAASTPQTRCILYRPASPAVPPVSAPLQEFSLPRDQSFDWLGERHVVYLKSGVCDGEMLFVLFGANGAPLVAVDDVETALDMVAERGLNFVAVH